MSTDLPLQEKRLKDLLWSGQMIDRASLAKERELNGKKWFDYRFISPAKAVRLFMNDYRDVFRRKMAQEVDVLLARLRTH